MPFICSAAQLLHPLTHVCRMHYISILHTRIKLCTCKRAWGRTYLGTPGLPLSSILAQVSVMRTVCYDWCAASTLLASSSYLVGVCMLLGHAGELEVNLVRISNPPTHWNSLPATSTLWSIFPLHQMEYRSLAHMLDWVLLPSSINGTCLHSHHQLFLSFQSLPLQSLLIHYFHNNIIMINIILKSTHTRS